MATKKAPSLELPSFSKEEILKALAKELADRTLVEQTAPERPPKPSKDWSKERRTCPKCGHEGPVIPDFGLKPPSRGKVYAQSWCRTCRSNTNYHREPRKYDVLAQSKRR